MTTPLERAPHELAPGREVWLKREDVHELGAFKWRAALPVVQEYARRGAPAVVTASTGNHGAATAWATQQERLRAIVYAPADASGAKVELLHGLGAEVRLVDGDLDDAKERARSDSELWGLPFFEDGAEPMQYQAYEAIGDEIAAQADPAPAAVLVPVGNGALLAGVGRALARRLPSTLRVGVVAKRAAVMADSWEAGRPVEAESAESIADGLAVRVAIPAAVEALRSAADRMVRVSERELARAMAAYSRAGLRVEAAGAATLAALPQLDDVQGPVVLVLTGRNIDDELWQRAVEEPESFPD
jgi:threonine dehydratase